MHSEINDQFTRVIDEDASRQDDVDCGCDEDDTGGMMVEPNKTDTEDACCCC